MAAFVATGEKAGSTCPASGGCNECIFKAHALRGEAVKVWSLDEGMARAPEGMIALIVGEEEEEIGLARGGGGKEEAQEEKAETRHGGRAWRKADLAKSRNPSRDLAESGMSVVRAEIGESPGASYYLAPFLGALLFRGAALLAGSALTVGIHLASCCLTGASSFFAARLVHSLGSVCRS